VAERLKQDSKQDARAVEAMEEVEDAEGNVMDRRTFEDLKRQGLLS
jgi:splicing factor 3A subunit 3